MAAALIGGALAAGASLYGASKAADAAKKAAKQQVKGIETGITQSQPYYDTAQGYLSPYVEMGTQGANILQDIMGINGPEKQAAALEMYKSSPSSQLLGDVREEAARRTLGTGATGGYLRSGRMADELSRRQSDITLNDYYKWQDLGTGFLNTGANASVAAANLAQGRGSDILGARSAQGTAQASGTAGAGNAWLSGGIGAGNYLGYGVGKTDFSKMFGGASPNAYAAGAGYGGYLGAPFAQNGTFNLNNLMPGAIG